MVLLDKTKNFQIVVASLELRFDRGYPIVMDYLLILR